MQNKHAILKDYFGYTTFRPGQESVIDALLAGRDALAVMPTGAGKSLCYQIPALLMKGLTIVISPLISLMKDQVRALKDVGVQALCLNSSLTNEEYAETIRRLDSGQCNILYIAPERLFKENFQALTAVQSAVMVVVDEAHCVSQWGHDFRPSYLRIAEFINGLKQRPIIAAFTATATPKVKEDILSLLGLREPFAITTGFDRLNLYFAVQKPANKITALLSYLKPRDSQSGIVYCNTRKTVEKVWETLANRGFAVAKYHAGLEDVERRENQDDFLYDRKTVMVATNAFGMGIDKSNVSFVIHYNMPKNIESYYQEAGRAGRDGERAECVLFYNGRDVYVNDYLIKHSGDDNAEVDEALIQHNLQLLKEITWYATGTECLRRRLLGYFGEKAPAFCGKCSNCNTLESTNITIEAQKIVSCVLRLEQRGRRFGKTMIIDILRGSKNEKIQNLRLDTLSVYGIMADAPLQTIRTILDFLIEQEYLIVETGDFPIVRSASRAREIVFERKPVQMTLPKAETKPLRRENVPAPQLFDKDLFEKLRSLRTTLAQAAKTPSYIVFSDASLMDMCRRKPKTQDEFLLVSGVGVVKLKRYGTAFLSLIREYESESGS
ncbi:MAG: DNA helicase RecQ [Treponema sp.]|nr:DNA helicase RecQ [Treponema sp.]